MKPTKRTKGHPRISAARRKETRRRLSLYDLAEKAERALYDAEAVATAARRFWEQSTADVAKAQRSLDVARDELIDYNDKRAAQSGQASAADMAFLDRLVAAFNCFEKKQK